MADDETLIGWVGRFVPIKDPLAFAAAAAEAAGSHPRARFVMIGGGPLEAELRARGRAPRRGARVAILGFRADMAQVYGALDLLVSTSRREGMPVVVLEAMAAALPSIVTSVGGAPELIVPERSGYLVPPADRSALVAAIGNALSLPREMRERLGAVGRDAGARALRPRTGAPPPRPALRGAARRKVEEALGKPLLAHLLLQRRERNARPSMDSQQYRLLADQCFSRIAAKLDGEDPDEIEVSPGDGFLTLEVRRRLQVHREPPERDATDLARGRGARLALFDGSQQKHLGRRQGRPRALRPTLRDDLPKARKKVGVVTVRARPPRDPRPPIP